MPEVPYSAAAFETIDFITSYNMGGAAFDYDDLTRTGTEERRIGKSVRYYEVHGEVDVYAIGYHGAGWTEIAKNSPGRAHSDEQTDNTDFITSYTIDR